MYTRFAFFFIAIAAAMAAGMYPDDHWTYSTKLTGSNFDDHIKESVDAGKTLFIKWIASEG